MRAVSVRQGNILKSMTQQNRIGINFPYCFGVFIYFATLSECVCVFLMATGTFMSLDIFSRVSNNSTPSLCKFRLVN